MRRNGKADNYIYSTVLTQFKELYSKLEEEKKKQANAALLTLP